MKKGRRILVVLAGGLLALLLWVAHFVFNPLGLGPMAPTVLGDDFFNQPSKNAAGLELLVGGEKAFSEILKAIDSAKTHIHIQTYIWKDDRIGRLVAERIRAAAGRGVKVTLRKDALGTFFELGDIINGRPSPVFTSSGLRHHANIKITVDPFADTDHSKYFIVDRQMVILGGMNIAEEYYRKWHDYMVRIRMPKWVKAFENKVLKGQSWPDKAPFFIAANDGRAVEIRTALVEMIDQARRTIVIEHAYFSTDKVIRAVERALQRGVQVSIILPKKPDTHIYANRVTINQLLQFHSKNPPKIFLFPEMMHAKVMLVDGKIAAVGSANLTLRSMLTRCEVTLFFHGEAGHPLIRELRGQLVLDILKSDPVETPFEIDLPAYLKAKIDQYVW